MSDNNEKQVIVPDGVKSISAYQYQEKDLDSIVLPDGLIDIGSKAFYGCKNLKEIELPNSVRIIESSCFAECANLTYVKLSNSLNEIASGAFRNCSSLTMIDVPKSVNSIKGSAFVGCENLQKIIIRNGHTELKNGIFGKMPNPTIISEKNSSVNEYADKYNIPFIDIADYVDVEEKNEETKPINNVVIKEEKIETCDVELPVIDDEEKKYIMKVEELKIELELLNDDIETKKAAISANKNILNNIETDLVKLNAERDVLKSEISRLKAECDKCENEFNEKLDEVDEAVKKRTDRAAESVKAAKEEAKAIIEKANELAKSKKEEAESNYQAIFEKAKYFEEREKELNQREQDIAKREDDEKAGFTALKAKEIIKYQKALEKLRDEISKQQEQKNNDIASIEVEKDEHRRKIFQAVEDELLQKRQELEDEKNNLEELIAQQKNDYEELVAEKEALAAMKIEEETKIKELDAKLNAMDSIISSKVAAQYTELSQQLHEANKQKEELRDRCTELSDKYDALFVKMKQSDKYDNVELHNQLEMYREENENLRDKLKNALVDDATYKELMHKAAVYTTLEEKCKELESKNDELESMAKLSRHETQTKEALETITANQEETIEKLSIEVDRYRNLMTDDEYRMSSIKMPVFDTSSRPHYYDRDISETDWLNEICKNIRDTSKLILDDRLVYAYHTALKNSTMSPLTVLAGVSGTGKSQLPKQYANFGGINFHDVAVKPDWDSPSSLFGFFNSIENKFAATELLRALNQMQDEHSDCRNQMLLILLDEMNLSHVELYFSDMLSKLESRRGDKAVFLPFDLGAGAKEQFKLKINRNVLWTGTMNEDETTKSLSDKVIDRSTLITFPRPEELHSRVLKNAEAYNGLKLNIQTWAMWLNNKVVEQLPEKRMKEYKSYIQDINLALEPVGRALGHRVWQGIEDYICNYPLLIEQVRSKKKNSGDIDDLMNRAFTEAVAFKVIPKLKGLETSGDYAEKCMSKIQGIIHNNIPDLSDDFDLACDMPSKLFQWSSAKFLKK